MSGMDTPSEKIAELAEYDLRDFVESISSYIRDTTDFIEKLKMRTETLSKDTILF